MSEAADLAQVHVESWRETYAHHLPTSHFTAEAVAHRTLMWTEVLASSGGPDRRIAVAEKGKVIIGLAGAGVPLSGGPRPWQLYSLYLLAEFHGSGAGQALLDAVVGTDPAFLWVARRNPRAQSFYRRNGFRPDGATRVQDLPVLRLVR